jgi:hypothetical protein
MNPQPIISRKTIQVVVYGAIFLAFALATLWIIRLFKKQAAGIGGGNTNGVNPNGTPAWIPPTVDQSYIQRIADMIVDIQKDEDFSGYSSERCEVTNNILGMRDEEVSALSIMLQQKYQVRLGATIGRWKGDGCFTSWFGGELDKLQTKVKNY